MKKSRKVKQKKKNVIPEKYRIAVEAGLIEPLDTEYDYIHFSRPFIDRLIKEKPKTPDDVGVLIIYILLEKHIILTKKQILDNGELVLAAIKESDYFKEVNA